MRPHPAFFTAAFMLSSTVALANPRALPFTYPSESLAKGAMEMEQYVDLTPVKTIDTTGAKTWTPAFKLTTEYEYGITDRLELGLYLQFSNNPGDGTGIAPLSFDGVKQRLRYRLAAPGQWPVDLSLYLELAELRNEFEIEAKVNLQRRVGRVRFMLNLWAEREFYYDGQGEWAINPTGGVTWQIHPIFHFGLEYWMRAEFGRATADPATAFNASAHEFVGPAALLQFGRFWWSTGAYVRLDGLHDPLPIGALYGHVWVRTIIGLDI
jgi:hypothetical protein